MEKQKSLYDQFVKGLADAITDIREKVVEEPWFGRVVNEHKVTEVNWGWPQAQEVRAQEAQPERAEQDHERNAADIDR
jgi:hypothetical protein